MSDHLKGKIVAYGLILRGDPFTSDESQLASVATETDAQRLALCWNAFDGLPTIAAQELNELGGVQRLIDEVGGLQKKLKVANAILREASLVYDVAVCSNRSSGLRAMAQVIRAYLEENKEAHQ